MPIFGNFRELPLPDVMALLESSTGKFEIWRFNRQYHYELQLHDRTITAFRFNGQEIFDFSQAKSFITELVQSNDGDFEFTRGGETTGPHSLRIPEVLSSSLTAADEMTALREHFPQPQTVFASTGRTKVWLEPELSEFWQASQRYFNSGVSGDDLVQKMGIYLDQILLKLYKLRASGLIEPQRAFTATGPIPLPALEEATVSAPSGAETVPALAAAKTDTSLLPIWSAPEPSPSFAADTDSGDTPSEDSAPSLEIVNPGMKSVRPLRASKKFIRSLMHSLKRVVGATS